MASTLQLNLTDVMRRFRVDGDLCVLDVEKGRSRPYRIFDMAYILGSADGQGQVKYEFNKLVTDFILTPSLLNEILVWSKVKNAEQGSLYEVFNTILETKWKRAEFKQADLYKFKSNIAKINLRMNKRDAQNFINQIQGLNNSAIDWWSADPIKTPLQKQYEQNALERAKLIGNSLDAMQESSTLQDIRKMIAKAYPTPSAADRNIISRMENELIRATYTYQKANINIKNEFQTILIDSSKYDTWSNISKTFNQKVVNNKNLIGVVGHAINTDIAAIEMSNEFYKGTKMQVSKLEQICTMNMFKKIVNNSNNTEVQKNIFDMFATKEQKEQGINDAVIKSIMGRRGKATLQVATRVLGEANQELGQKLNKTQKHTGIEDVLDTYSIVNAIIKENLTK